MAHAIWHFRKSKFSEESKECKGEKAKEYDDKAMKTFKNIARSYYEDFETRDYPKGKFDETCMDAVPLSFYLLSQASSFEDAIRLAISHGGDSDTIGAIVGSIAEARFGIPQEIKVKAYQKFIKELGLSDKSKQFIKQYYSDYGQRGKSRILEMSFLEFLEERGF